MRVRAVLTANRFSTAEIQQPSFIDLFLLYTEILLYICAVIWTVFAAVG